MPAPLPVKFFHFAGDLQQACRLGQIKKGDNVMFNAGSLLTWKALAGPRVKMASYAVVGEITDALQRYKQRHDFKIGLYVQEPDIDFNAIKIIIECCKMHSELFDLGLAWGGVQGRAAGDICATFSSPAVGKSTQKYAGKSWSRRKSAADVSREVSFKLKEAQVEIEALKVQLKEAESIMLSQIRRIHLLEGGFTALAESELSSVSLDVDASPGISSMPLKLPTTESDILQIPKLDMHRKEE